MMSEIQQFNITVLESNKAPVITSSPITTVIENQLYSYNIEAEDVNNDNLKFKLIKSPLGMMIDEIKDIIKWTPTEAQAGVYAVEVVAIDDGQPAMMSEMQRFNITVLESNKAPVITSSPITTAKENQLYNYNVVAEDSNNDSLKFILTKSPPGMVMDKDTGDIYWTPSHIQSGSSFIIELIATDNGNPSLSSAVHQFSVDVTPDKPNIVLIVADDLGYGDLGVYGSTTISTPNLDLMASNGIRLTDFYAAPSCGPLRASMLTGTYSPRISNAFTRIPNDMTGIHYEEITIAEMLKNVGYKTALVGKWHLGDHPQFMPWNQGFDYFFGLPYSNDMWPFQPLICPHENEDPRLTAARERVAITGCEGCDSSYCYPLDLFPDLPLYDNQHVISLNPDQTTLASTYTQKALDFIEKNQSNPFFLYFPSHAPHVPLFPSDQFKGTSAAGLYGDVVEEMDWSIGKIVQKIEELNLSNNTLIIFLSDNGPWLEYGIDGGSAGPLRGGKHTNYEGGVRTPAIISWPGQIPAGQVSSEIIHNIDLLPTIASATNITLPIDRIIDGQNVWPILSGQADTSSPHDYILYYNEKPNLKYIDQTLNIAAIRQGKWKLHFNLTGKILSGRELYDLENDLGENNNLLNGYPQITNQLLTIAQSFNDTLRNNIRPLGQVTQTENYISGALNKSPSFINLTTTGTTDWIHWGLNDIANYNRKISVTPFISDFSLLGLGIPEAYTPSSGKGINFQWTDGNPTISAQTNSLVYIKEVNNGFQLSLSANNTTNTANLHLGAWQARGKITVELSEGSTPPLNFTIDNPTNIPLNQVLTLQYSATTANTKLIVKYTMDRDYAQGNIALYAATLRTQ